MDAGSLDSVSVIGWGSWRWVEAGRDYHKEDELKRICHFVVEMESERFEMLHAVYVLWEKGFNADQTDSWCAEIHHLYGREIGQE